MTMVLLQGGFFDIIKFHCITVITFLPSLHTHVLRRWIFNLIHGHLVGLFVEIIASKYNYYLENYN